MERTNDVGRLSKDQARTELSVGFRWLAAKQLQQLQKQQFIGFRLAIITQCVQALNSSDESHLGFYQKNHPGSRESSE